MELRQLKYFNKAAELLNFTEAARKLFISQSTLSQQIKQLEDELGILLFDRIGKSILLTEAGVSFLPFARKTIRDSEDGKQIMKDLQELQKGELYIGVTYSLSSLLTATLIRFSEKYPQIKLYITFATSSELENKLNNNEVDFILSLEPKNFNDQFDYMSLFSSNLHFVVSRTHKLSTLKQISLKQLSNLQFILPAKGFITRDSLDELFLKNNITPNIKMEINDVNAILKLVKTGYWTTILSLASVRDDLDLIAIPIQTKELSTHASLFWAKGSYRKKSAIAFANIISRIDEV